MFFTFPIWLLGLFPWAAVVVYMFIGRHPKQVVPFLQLWSDLVGNPKPKRSLRRPPWFVILLLVSMLLGILGAAGPGIRSSSAGELTTIILDRGITMSPTGRDGKPFRGMLGMADSIVGTVELIPVPGESVRCTGSDWERIAEKMSPTALDTQAAIEQAVAQRLRSSSGTVIVLSDRVLNQSDDRLVQIPPENAVEDVGIAEKGARAEPWPQVMVRLRNQSRLDSVPLRITTGSESVSEVVKLPANGEMRNYFIDIARPLGDTVAVEIEPYDDAAVDDRAWLVQERFWPMIEAAGSLPPSVAKLIAVYSSSRPAGAASIHIAVGDAPPSSEENGVWLVSGKGESGWQAAEVSAHVIARNIQHWPAAADTRQNLPEGFEPIVTRNGKAIVGIHQNGVRQVWMNLDLEDWSRTPDFVVFFANVFDWINAGGGEEYVGHRVGEESGDLDVQTPGPEVLRRPGLHGDQSGSSEYLRTGVWLWPGLYRDVDGHLVAVNAPDVRWNPPPVTHWREELGRYASYDTGGSSYPSWFCLAAIFCALLAVLVW